MWRLQALSDRPPERSHRVGWQPFRCPCTGWLTDLIAGGLAVLRPVANRPQHRASSCSGRCSAQLSCLPANGQVGAGRFAPCNSAVLY